MTAQIITGGLTIPARDGEVSPGDKTGLFDTVFSLISANMAGRKAEKEGSDGADTQDSAEAPGMLLLMQLLAGLSLTPEAGPEGAAGGEGGGCGEDGADRTLAVSLPAEAGQAAPVNLPISALQTAGACRDNEEGRTADPTRAAGPDTDGGEGFRADVIPAAADSLKAADESKTDITDILEGNLNSGSTDAASRPAQVPERPEPSAGGKNEEILARMPQIIALSSETDSSAAEEKQTFSGGMCPLENISETEPADGTALPSKSGGEGGEKETLNTAPERKDDLGPEQAEEKSSRSEAGWDAAPTGAGEVLPAPHADGGAAQSRITAEDAVSDALRQLDRVMSGYKQQSGHFSIQLEPEEFGKLSVTVSMGRDGLTARIHTESTQVQSVLAGQIDKLISRLGDSGIPVKNMDVVCFDMGGRQEKRESGGNGAQQRGRTAYVRSIGGDDAESGRIGIYDICARTGESTNTCEYLA